MPSKSTASSSANSRRSRNSSSSSINNAEDPENFAQQVCELLSWYILVLPVLYLSYVVASEDTHLSALLGGIASSAAIFYFAYDHAISQYSLRDRKTDLFEAIKDFVIKRENRVKEQ